MEEEAPIRVNFQLPASALDSLARLTEQLRLLTLAARRQSPPDGRREEERGENGSFDPARFQALRRQAEAPEAPSAGPPPASRDAAHAEVPGPDGADQPSGDAPDRREPAPPRSPGGAPSAEAAAPPEEWTEPAVRAVQTEAAASPASPPAAGREPEGRLPEARRMRGAEAASAQADLSGGADVPPAAIPAVTDQLETPQGRWAGIVGELAAPGPAPLTAEAVSHAFQRDGRRYDNGFPLY